MNEYNIRNTVDAYDLEEMKRLILEAGPLDPIIVESLGGRRAEQARTYTIEPHHQRRRIILPKIRTAREQRKYDEERNRIERAAFIALKNGNARRKRGSS